jgi:hypothetical protein
VSWQVSESQGRPADGLLDRVVSRELGRELRQAREAAGLSRLQLVSRLPSGIGDRTLLSYEHGARTISVVRWIEVSHGLEIAAPTLLARGLQRARIHLENLPLAVDLRAVANDESATFRPMVQWARNTLNEHPDGVVEVEPAVVRHLALFVGCAYLELARYFARFSPDNYWTRPEDQNS